MVRTLATCFILVLAAACGSSGAGSATPATGDAGATPLAVGDADLLVIGAEDNFQNAARNCRGKSKTAYTVDFSKGSVHLDAVGLCDGDGGAPSTVKDVALAPEQRSEVLARARAMAVEAAGTCVEDAPLDSVVVQRAGGASDAYVVDGASCHLGETAIRHAEFKALMTKLAALVGYDDPLAVDE